MGQFISSINLAYDQIVALAAAAVTDAPTAINNLELITTALTPRTPIESNPVAESTPLNNAISDALTAASNESVYLFNATFPSVNMPDTCFGVVLNYDPNPNDYQSLTKQIEECFLSWGMPVSLAGAIAGQIQPQVMASRLPIQVMPCGFTPSATYGRAATNNVVINDPVITVEYLFWVVAFGVYQTGGTNTDGTNNLAAVYSFSAATGMLKGVVL